MAHSLEVWESIYQNLGNIPANGQSAQVHFKLKSTAPVPNFVIENGIPYMKPSCGCSSVTWNPNLRTVTMEIKVDPVPLHIVRDKNLSNEYNKRVDVTVKRHDGGQVVEDKLVVNFKAFKP